MAVAGSSDAIVNAARTRTLLLALSTATLPFGCQGGSDDGTTAWGRSGSAPVGKMAPTLAGKTIEGQRVALSDLRGQVVLVNVWATWCGPCKKELPELAHLHDELSPKGFSVFGVSVDKRRVLGKVRLMVEQSALRYPMLFDPEGAALSA